MENISQETHAAPGTVSLDPPLQETAPPTAALILAELRRIMESPYFRGSSRGKQVLSYIVNYYLEQHPEPLKERIIGAAIFNRPINYDTGDDSVVRAQAREVRHRLEKYYASQPEGAELQINLPIGSYTPQIKWLTEKNGSLSPLPSSAIVVASQPDANKEQLAPPPKATFWHAHGHLSLALLLLLLAIVSGLALFAHMHQTVLEAFWEPALNGHKQPLICLPKPALYRPSYELYKRTEQRPGEFTLENYRMTHRPHLQPDSPLTWGEMTEYEDFGVGKGDVKAAATFTAFLAQHGKGSSMRIGNEYTFQDLRDSPAVVIGAFSNEWTMKLTANMHFFFIDDEHGLWIKERAPNGRKWQATHGNIGADYGLVTRLLDSSTGQFNVFVAGIEGSGSAAASELIVNPTYLQNALRNAPSNWAKMNVQILVKTEVHDNVAGPPEVLATYFW